MLADNAFTEIKGGLIPEFSIIITCYYEEKSIDEFHSRLSRTMQATGRNYEIIFVNDGSQDKTFEHLKDIFQKDPYVSTIINLFRNAGQGAAITAGITKASGTHIVLMDSDLQMEPEELPLLIAEFDKGYDIVSGYRKDRRDSLLRTLPSKLANMVMRRTAHHNMRDFGCTFKIFHGKLVRAFEFGPHKEIKAAYVYAGAQKCAEIPITHHERKYGKSGWTIKKLMGYYMDNLVGASQRPFQLLCFVCAIFAFLFFIRIAMGWIVNLTFLPVVTPGLILNVIVFNLLVLLSVIGIVGEYVIRNFIKLQQYPIYIIKDIYQKSKGID